jgi:hypothetical protein
MLEGTDDKVASAPGWLIDLRSLIRALPEPAAGTPQAPAVCTRRICLPLQGSRHGGKVGSPNTEKHQRG